MTIRDLPEMLKIAHRVADEEWRKLTPEKRRRIRDNLLRKAQERIEAKRRTGNLNQTTDQNQKRKENG